MFAPNQHKEIELYPQLPPPDDTRWQQALVLERRQRVTVLRDIPEDYGAALHDVHSGDMIYIIRAWRYDTWIAAMVGYRVGWLNIAHIKPRLLDPNQYYTPIPTHSTPSYQSAVEDEPAPWEAPTRISGMNTEQAWDHHHEEQYYAQDDDETAYAEDWDAPTQPSTYGQAYDDTQYYEPDHRYQEPYQEPYSEEQMAWLEEVHNEAVPEAVSMDSIYEPDYYDVPLPVAEPNVSSNDVSRIIRFLKGFVSKRG